MKLVIVIMTALLVNVHASVLAQRISLNEKKASLQKVMDKISKQTGYDFLVFDYDLIAAVKDVTIQVEKTPLKDALNQLLASRGLQYSIEDNSIVIREAKKEISVQHVPVETKVQQEYIIRGEVRSAADGQAIEGASIIVDKKFSKTDRQGRFTISVDKPTGMLTIKHIGYNEQRVAYESTNALLDIILISSDNVLDETLVIGYGTTTRRLSTGSVIKVTSDEIRNQPVTNPILALQGRVSGLEVSPSSGISGAGVKMKIRGTGSLAQGTTPLVLLNGNPIALDGNSISRLTNAAGVDGLSFFNLINPADVESIEVLKDADATAIYGSRGANGVILITTKASTQSGLQINFKADNGFQTPANTMEMLNTEEYLRMRREAFANSKVEISSANAPDILVMDTTKYLDYRKYLSGNSTIRSDYNLSLNGGSNNTHFGLSAGFNKENFQVLDDKYSRRLTFLSNINHKTSDNRFTTNFTVAYANNVSNLTAYDPSIYLRLPPHLQLKDQKGDLIWTVGNTPFRSLGLQNPLAEFNYYYRGKFNSLMTNLGLDYKFENGLLARVTGGYTWTGNQENSQYPSSAIDPSLKALPSAQIAMGTTQSFIIEPQLSYHKKISKHDVQLLAGAALQHNYNDNITVSGNNFVSDIFINDIANAAIIKPNNTGTVYRYAALFGRLTYNYASKYLLNISLRNDGSSRFGTGKQQASFYSIGTGWIFSEEPWLKEVLPIISFGKLRASLGTSGNDKIGNYMYLDSWSSMGIPYAGIPAMQPTKLFNADYSWEKNKKIEVALDLGFFKDRILLSATYFKTKSGNQLISYLLPSQSGFTSILRNWDAVIENTGLEATLQAAVFRSNQFSWDIKYNMTLPKNKLKDFPDLDNSAYSNRYQIGKSLSLLQLYKFTGIDDETGIYTFEDVNGDGVYNAYDQTSFIEMNTKFYGGLSNTLRYKSWSLGFLLDFKKQKGMSYIASLSTAPGYNLVNHPRLVLDRWQKPGDQATLQRFVASTADPAYAAAQRFAASSGIIVDASYIKLRNCYVNYELPMAAIGLGDKQIKRVQFFASVQNLLTFSNYTGGDPEMQNPFITPASKTFSFGLNISM